MKVIIVNTSEKTGGAAVASRRLMDALNNNGVKAMMLVRDKETERVTVSALPGRRLQQWNFYWERLVIFLRNRFSRSHLFEIDIANTGTDITRLPEFKEADVVHLAWINQGMLSIENIGKILSSGKPVVWTMHDAWPATSICHYTRGCDRFHTQCTKCPIMYKGLGDMAKSVWNRKKRAYSMGSIHFVACSLWLARKARQSALLSHHAVTNIPNPIDTRTFSPADKGKARKECGLPLDKRIILFVSQRVTDSRKGVDYFISAVNEMAELYPDMQGNTIVAILGGHAEDVVDAISLPAVPLGYVSDTKMITAIYNSSDVFVLPSLEDNLPNTIMEAMACGVPCVGFNVGGIPEMIDHMKNGYVAAYKDSHDLSAGISWVLRTADSASLSHSAVSKVATHYSQQSVAVRYIEVYNQAIACQRYNI